MKEINSQLKLKNLNRRMVLQYMRSNEKVTKAGVAAVTGLTFMAIKKIIHRLEELSLVRADQYEIGTKVGRKVLTYTINEQYGYAVGVYINRFATQAAVIDLKGNILSLAKHDMDALELESQQALVNMLLELIRKVIEDAPVDRAKILGIGVGAPGPVDITEGAIISPPNFPALAYLPLANILREYFAYPVLLQKDTNAIALGEYWNGAGRGYSNMVYVDIDIGIGSGLVIDGQINAGVNQLAGEFGHIIMEAQGPLCTCGNRGCLEALSSGTALLKEFSARLEEDRRHPLYENRTRLTVRDILDAAEKNDLLAMSVVNKAAVYTGIAIHNLIHILDPQVIVLGGMLIENYVRYTSIIKNVVNEKKLKSAKDSDIRISALGSRAGVIGAGDIVVDYFFREMLIDIFNKDELN